MCHISSYKTPSHCKSKRSASFALSHSSSACIEYVCMRGWACARLNSRSCFVRLRPKITKKKLFIQSGKRILKSNTERDKGDEEERKKKHDDDDNSYENGIDAMNWNLKSAHFNYYQHIKFLPRMHIVSTIHMRWTTTTITKKKQSKKKKYMYKEAATAVTTHHRCADV